MSDHLQSEVRASGGGPLGLRLVAAALGALLPAALAVAPAAAGEILAPWSSALPLERQAEHEAGSVEIETELELGGLSSPVAVTHAGDGSGRIFIVEQVGTIRLSRDGQTLPFPFLDIQSKVDCCGEQGLLGLAFHPDYDVNGFFYVNYTDTFGDTVIARYSVHPNNPNRALPDSEVVLETVDQPFSNHNGGNLEFGPDGMLYVGMGDGGSQNDPGNRAQDLMTLLGKILRLDVDNPPDYIPADNPFVGDPDALDEIWSYGVRNPWRFGFDRETGDLIIGDVGQFAVEEIDFQPSTSSGGENWGWRVLEGSRCNIDDPPGICDDFLTGDSVLPILEYSHSGGRCSVTGGRRYRGGAFPDLAGIYFYADFCTGEIFGATEDAPGVWSSEELLDTGFLISAFGEDEEGEIYVADLGGAVHRLLSAAGGGVPCEDVQRFQARCIAPGGNNRIQARVTLTDTSHDGESVTIGVDGEPEVAIIDGRRAQIQQPGATSGPHTISLDDPAGCFADIVVVCPAAPAD